jgi:hypothetical protein
LRRRRSPRRRRTARRDVRSEGTTDRRERGVAYIAALAATARLQVAFGLLLTLGLVLA